MLLPGVIFLSLMTLIEAEYNLTEYVIQPPTLSQRGAIGRGRVCPPNTVAMGFRMKVQIPEDDDEIVDDDLVNKEEIKDFSALNAIRLLCSDDTEAISAEGVRGQWTEYLKCQGKKDFIHGVKLKTEPWRGWEFDDVGATNFEAICKSGARLSHKGLTPKNYNPRFQQTSSDRGRWGDIARCPDEAPAVCGIKSRIDGPIAVKKGRGKYKRKVPPVYQVPDAVGDASGLTGVHLKCCQV